MDTFKLNDINNVNVEIAYDQLLPIIKDYTDGYIAGYNKGRLIAAVVSSTIVATGLAVTSIAVDAARARRRNKKN